MTLQSTLSVVGQVVLGGFFVLASLNVVFDAEREAAWAESKGVPYASIAIYLAALAWLVGGAAVIADPFVDVNALVAGVAILCPLLVVVTLVMHDFWSLAGRDGLHEVGTAEGDAVQLLPPKTSETMTFLSNVALFGALLALL